MMSSDISAAMCVDRTVMLKDVHSGKVTVLYNAMETISKLRTPTLKDQEVPEALLFPNLITELFVLY